MEILPSDQSFFGVAEALGDGLGLLLSFFCAPAFPPALIDGLPILSTFVGDGLGVTDALGGKEPELRETLTLLLDLDSPFVSEGLGVTEALGDGFSFFGSSAMLLVAVASTRPPHITGPIKRIVRMFIRHVYQTSSAKAASNFASLFPAQARAMLANSLRGVLAQLLLKKADGSGRVAVNEILIANAAVSAIIREGATQKLQDVIVSGKAQGMQFMDDAIWALLQQGTVTPHEAFMKAIDKNRFKIFLPAEEQGLGHAAGAVRIDAR